MQQPAPASATETTVETTVSSRARFSSGRVLVGFVVALFIYAMIFAGGWWWTACVALTLYQGFRELQTIFRAKGVNPSETTVFTVGVFLILLAHFDKKEYLLPMITLGIVAAFIRLLFRKPPSSINDIGATFLAIFYVGFLPMHFIMLRQLNVMASPLAWADSGALYVALTCLVIAFSDIGAYYVGKLFGKHPLYPEVSPKKTREGALGGLVVGVLFGLLFAALPQFGWGHAVVLSVLLVVVSQLGDLAESQMKRDAGVKDSGKLLQGHGGLLDRVDSYLFCGALSYYYIYWVVLGQGLASELLPWLHP